MCENKIAFYSKGFTIQNSSAKYELWFKYPGIVKKKKSLIAVAMQNTERVFILFLLIIHTVSRSSHLEPSTLKTTLNQFSCENSIP